MERPELSDYKDEIYHSNGAIEDVWRHNDYVEDLEKYTSYLEDKLKLLNIAGVGETLPTDEEIRIEAYNRDFFNAEEEACFRKGAVWMKQKLT